MIPYFFHHVRFPEKTATYELGSRLSPGTVPVLIPCQGLISDFQPPKPWKANLCLSAFCLWYFDTAAWTSTLDFLDLWSGVWHDVEASCRSSLLWTLPLFPLLPVTPLCIYYVCGTCPAALRYPIPFSFFFFFALCFSILEISIDISSSSEILFSAMSSVLMSHQRHSSFLLQHYL